MTMHELPAAAGPCQQQYLLGQLNDFGLLHILRVQLCSSFCNLTKCCYFLLTSCQLLLQLPQLCVQQQGNG